MSDVMLALVVHECKSAAEGETDFEERIKKCMRAAQNHWMVTDEDAQFRGAIAAAHIMSSPDEKLRLEKTLRVLRMLAAATSGVPVDWSQMLEDDDGVEGVPLQKMWSEVKAASGPPVL